MLGIERFSVIQYPELNKIKAGKCQDGEVDRSTDLGVTHGDTKRGSG
ncbi:hypothetical protein M798_14200 [Brucella melitensis ADMAS-G1]|nr:hypothetical protein M798_14200 [Brucella melitensis ADMAS-G1]